MPRVGHLEQEFHIFGYFNAHLKGKLGFYPARTSINENGFQKCDWKEVYREAEEAISGNIPVARGNFMSTHCCVDANHAGDTETRKY